MPLAAVPQTDVVVVGAGLAGLCTALAVHRAGRQATVLEAEDDVGGRVRTDLVDGFRLDHGFQLYNPAYPEGRRMLDHGALDLRPFSRGLAVVAADRAWRLGDPRDHVEWSWEAIRAPFGTLRDRARFAAYALRTARRRPSALTHQVDMPARQALRELHLSDGFVDAVLRPFLAGVFLEDDLATSRRFLDLVLRSFLRDTPSVPARGMQDIPRQLAAGLPEGTVRLGTRVRSVGPGVVHTDNGPLTARAVVVATDPAAAAALLPGLHVPTMRSVTTWYHAVDLAEEGLPDRLPLLHVDGERRGPLVNSVVVSQAAGTYAPAGHALVSSSALGVHGAELDDSVREHLRRLYATDPSRWQLIARYPIAAALPAMPPPHDFRRPVRLEPGLYVAGDHRDSSSIQGAMVSGRRAATALLAELGVHP